MPNRSFTIECGPNTRNFTITQDGESREFQIATGVGPAGPAGSDADPYTLPIATDTTLGGIKSSTDILVDGSGVATVDTVSDGVINTNKILRTTEDGQIAIRELTIGNTLNLGQVIFWDGDSSNNVLQFTENRFKTNSDVIAYTSDIPSLSSYQTTAGTLALGGFSSITGTIAISNIGGLGTGVGTALAINVGSTGSFVTNGGSLGTPTSGTLTNCTGLPVSGITASTSTALGVGSIELGHASDTTITRASAGTIAVEGVNVITTTTGDARYQPIIQGVVSTAQADATTTTPADVTGMTGVSLLADTWYRLEFSGQVTTTTGASWQIEMATSQNLARTSGTFGSINNAGNTAAGQVSFQSAQRVILTQRSTTGTAVPNYASFIFKTGSSAPTVKISFLQWTSPTGTASLLSGAAAVWTKLPM